MFLYIAMWNGRGFVLRPNHQPPAANILGSRRGRHTVGSQNRLLRAACYITLSKSAVSIILHAKFQFDNYIEVNSIMRV